MHPWKEPPTVRLTSPTRGCERVKLSLTGGGLSSGTALGGKSGRCSGPVPPTDSGHEQMSQSKGQNRSRTLTSLPTLLGGAPSVVRLMSSSCTEHFGLEGTKSKATMPFRTDNKRETGDLAADGEQVGLETRQNGPLNRESVAIENQEPGRSVESDEQVATAATNTDFPLRPPWAAVHIGSHDLSLCPPQPRRIVPAAPAAAVSFMATPQRLEKRGSSLASRVSVVPRRRTFTTFREWLAEDHRHSRKAWGPSGQFPARRGLSHSATTERSRILLSAAATQRSAAESRARHAVEAEVRELSTNQTPQQQQEAYVKAQQKALALQRQEHPSVDESVAREEARATAAAAAAAAASAAIAQAQWPSRHKLRQQELEQMHRQEEKEKQCLSSGSARSREQQPSGIRTPSRARNSDTTTPEAQKQTPEKTFGRSTFALRKKEEAPTTAAPKTKYAAAKLQNQPPVKCPWPTKRRPSGQPTSTRLKQLSAQERLQRTSTGAIPDTGNNMDYMDGTSQASGDEEDAPPFNPLDEVLVLLRKLKRDENYSVKISRNKRGAAKGTRKDGSKQESVQAFSAVAESVCSNTRASDLSGKILTGLGPSEPSHAHEQYEGNPLQYVLPRLKYLPLEAFDIPEEYGESSPEALLQRCRLECQKRRLQRSRSARSPASFDTVCNADACTLPEPVGTSPCVPSEDALKVQRLPQEHEVMEFAPQKPGTLTTGEAARKDIDQQCVSSHKSELSEEKRAILGAEDSPVKHTTGRAVAQFSKDRIQGNAAISAGDDTDGEAEAEVLHFVGNSWTHIPCVVLRYNHEQNRFEVKLRDGTLKAVRRLALRFCFEPPQLQQQRIETCTSRRRQALTRQHFLNSVNGLPSSAFSPLPQSFISCIIKTATGVGRLRNRSVFMDSLRSAVSHLKTRFLEASKLSAVLYCAERLRVAGKLESRLVNYPLQQKHQQLLHMNEESQEGEENREQAPLLQVLQPMLPAPPPALGRLDIGVVGAFEAALAPLRRKPLFANNKTFRVCS